MMVSFLEWSFKKVAVIVLVVSFLAGGVGASQYFVVSNTLTDEISVIMDNTRKTMTLAYCPGGELGGENKTLKVGVWEEFGVKLINDSPEAAEPWENILIRVKLYGLDNEHISCGYKNNGVWENSCVYDLRTIEASGVGGVVDLGPEGGWTISSQATRNFKLRVKFGASMQDLQVEMRAIVSSDGLEAEGENLKDPESTSILEPTQDAYIHQADSLVNYGSEDYLEVTTQENANAHALLEFDSTNIPSQMSSAKLNLYQYWGSGFSDLRTSGVAVQVYSVSGEWSESTVTWENQPAFDNIPITEASISGTGDWYAIDITDYISNLGTEKNLSFLIKFSQDSFDNKERRIRFKSRESENPPYVSITTN